MTPIARLAQTCRVKGFRLTNLGILGIQYFAILRSPNYSEWSNYNLMKYVRIKY